MMAAIYEANWPSLGLKRYEPVHIVGETATKYRIRAIGDSFRMPLGRNGVREVLRSGTALVPKAHVHMLEESMPERPWCGWCGGTCRCEDEP